MTGEPRWFRSPPAIFALGALAFVVLTELVLGRGGSGSLGDFSLFLGRFHPLVVHLPIGVLVLVGLAEAASFVPRFRSRIDPALGLGLPFVVLVTVTAFVLGHLLGRAGGYAAHALTLHRRLEFLAAVGVCLSAALFVRQVAVETGAARTAYRAALGLTLALLSVGAHFGGTVTHGDSYLTEYAPGPVRALLGGTKAAPRASGSAAPKKMGKEPLVFDDVVLPILEKYCVDCHGPKKQKGKLRLDSLDAISKGGEDDAALVAGSSATSELVRRVRLPADDDDRMPPEGKPGPSAEELAVIAFWIDRGASAALRVGDTLAPVNGRKLLESALAAKPRLPGAVSSARPEPSARAADEDAKDPAPAESAGPSAAKAPAEAKDEPKRDGAAEPKTDSEPKPDAAKPSEPSPETDAARSSSASGRAVLAERCEKCHGASKKKGGLRVDSLEALVAGGENGPALVPGEPEKSEIVRRMRLPLAQKEHMPPKKEAQPSAAEIQSLAAWVRGLAKSAPGAKAKPPAGENTKGGAAAPPSAPEEPSPSAEAEAPPTSEATKPAAASSSATAAEPAGDAPADDALLARVPERFALYEQAVAPLLKKRCSKCHTGEKPAARLRIDDYNALVEGGLSGPGIVPGKPDDSLVCQRIGLPASDDDRMPPEGEPPITADEVALVRFWVERGASASLVVASSDVPAAPLRAVAEYAPRGGESPAVHADAGCAACAVGASSGGSRAALWLAAAALGAFFTRRTARARRV